MLWIFPSSQGTARRLDGQYLAPIGLLLFGAPPFFFFCAGMKCTLASWVKLFFWHSINTLKYLKLNSYYYNFNQKLQISPIFFPHKMTSIPPTIPPFFATRTNRKGSTSFHVSSYLIPLAEIRSVASRLHFFPSLLTMYSDRTPYFI